MKTFKDLIVWQKSFDLSYEIYQLTKQFPRDEMFAIVSQIRRAAVSIPANIAEGFGRKTDKEFERFIRIAYGSATELETHLLLSQKLEYGYTPGYSHIFISLEEVMKNAQCIL